MEKEMIKRTLYDSIMYIETGGRGYGDATDEERAAAANSTERVLNAMRKLQGLEAVVCAILTDIKVKRLQVKMPDT